MTCPDFGPDAHLDSVALDPFSAFPGSGCIFSGFIWRLFLTTLGFMMIIVGHCAWWWRRDRKGDGSAWRTLKQLIWLSKLLLPAVSQTIITT